VLQNNKVGIPQSEWLGMHGVFGECVHCEGEKVGELYDIFAMNNLDNSTMQIFPPLFSMTRLGNAKKLYYRGVVFSLI
jgi:hypothetical protein